MTEVTINIRMTLRFLLTISIPVICFWLNQICMPAFEFCERKENEKKSYMLEFSCCYLYGQIVNILIQLFLRYLKQKAQKKETKSNL